MAEAHTEALEAARTEDTDIDHRRHPTEDTVCGTVRTEEDAWVVCPDA